MQPADAHDPRHGRLALVGDVHGAFAALADLLHRAQDEVGPIDVALAVGDVEACRDEDDLDGVASPPHHRHLGEFPDVVAGRIALPVPLAFIGGNHDPYPALDAAGPGPWGHPDVRYLGRVGVSAMAGMRVAYLSGIWSASLSPEPASTRAASTRQRLKAWTYHCADERRLLAETSDPVDVLVTHDWPADVDPPFDGRGRGHETMTDLAAKLAPAFHVCGHHHVTHEGRVGDSTVICLARVGRPGALTVIGRRDGELAEVLRL